MRNRPPNKPDGAGRRQIFSFRERVGKVGSSHRRRGSVLGLAALTLP